MAQFLLAIRNLQKRRYTTDMDGVASGAMHGDSLYVNNARYGAPPGDTAQWITEVAPFL